MIDNGKGKQWIWNKGNSWRKMKDTQYGALTMPIYQTSTFEFDCCEQGGRRFAGEEKGYIYTRLGNPSISAVENKVALLEGGEACAAASSGMGAVSACLWSIAGAGKHILADETLYGCTFALLNHGMTRYGVEVTFVDTSDLEQVKTNLKENTVCVYLETPANPNLKISDIQAVAELAHAYNPAIQVVCDNTICISLFAASSGTGGGCSDTFRNKISEWARGCHCRICGRDRSIYQ